MEFVAVEDGGTRVSYCIRAQVRGEGAMRHFEAAMAVMRQGFPFVGGPALRRAIEEDADALGLYKSSDPEDRAS